MDNRSVVARYFDMWNTGDTSIADQILHPDWTDHAHPEVAGPEGVQRAVQTIRAARPGLHFDIHSILGEDDLVAAVGSIGPGHLIWLIRLVDGRMVEMWTYHR